MVQYKRLPVATRRRIYGQFRGYGQAMATIRNNRFSRYGLKMNKRGGYSGRRIYVSKRGRGRSGTYRRKYR